MERLLCLQYGLWVCHVMRVGTKLRTSPWLGKEGGGWRQKRNSKWPVVGSVLETMRGGSFDKEKGQMHDTLHGHKDICLSPEAWPGWAEAYSEPTCRGNEEGSKKKRYVRQGSYQNEGFNLTNPFSVSLPWSCVWVVFSLVIEQRRIQ